MRTLQRLAPDVDRPQHMTADQPAEHQLATPRDTWNALDALIRTTRIRLSRDDGASERITLPPLLDQLIDAMETGSGTKTGNAQQSRPPLDTAALSLLIEIAQTTRSGCWNWNLKRSRNIPTDLRQIVSAVIHHGDADTIDQLHDRLKSWCAQIRTTISSDPDRTWRMHGAACRVCASTTVPAYDEEGQESRQPALIVHSEDGVIDRIQCGFCGSTLAGEDLTQIVLDTLKTRAVEPPSTDAACA